MSVNASHLFFHLDSLSQCVVFARQLISLKTSSSQCVPTFFFIKASPISHSSALANDRFKIWSQKVAHLDQKEGFVQTKGPILVQPLVQPLRSSGFHSPQREKNCVSVHQRPTLRLNVAFHKAQSGHVATADYSGAVGNRGGGESFVTVRGKLRNEM